MFCSKCGSKISEKEEKCSSCGALRGTADRCGGFFDLINQQVAKKAEVSVTQDPGVDLEHYYRCRKEAEDEEMRKKMLIVLSAVCIVLLATVLVQMFMLNSVLDAQNKISEVVADIDAHTEHKGEGNCEICGVCMHNGEKTTKHETVKNSDDVVSCYCECGELLEEQAKIGHISNNDGTHNVVCTHCNTMYEEGVDCDWGDWTDAVPGDGHKEHTCRECEKTMTCGNEVEEAYSYEAMDDNKTKHIKTCSVCEGTKEENCVFRPDTGKCKHCTNTEEADDNGNSVPSPEEQTGEENENSN